MIVFDYSKIVCYSLKVFLLVTFITTTSFTQEQDIEGSKDHPLISRYTDSIIIGYEVKEFDEFNLPLGGQIGGYGKDLKFSKSQRLEGKIARILYKPPKNRSTFEIHHSYQLALQKAGFKILFTCSKDECGGLFKNIIWSDERAFEKCGYAFAEVKNQRYLSARLSRLEGDIYVSLYVAEHDSIIEKWSGHSLTLLEIIEIKSLEEGLVTINTESLSEIISRTGHVAIYDIYFDIDKAEVKSESEPVFDEIAGLLQQNPDLKLYVVGHTDNVGELAYNMKLSQARADAVVKFLISEYGIDENQLLAYGVGPLVPVASNRTEEGRAKNRRVELVER